MRLFLVAFISGCIVMSSCTPHARQTEIPIFLYSELQDSVKKYVESTPPIENTLDLPTFTQVFFNYFNGDTVVFARPALSPYPSTGRDSVVGANYLGGRICEVIYSIYGSFKHLPGIVNEKELIIQQEDYDAYASLPPEVEIGESFFFEILKKGTMDRAWIINRPEPLKLIVIDGKSATE